MKYLVIFFTFIFGFILNILWEYSHYQLYIDLSGISPNTHLLMASFFDALFITIIIFFIIYLKKYVKINNKLKWLDYYLVIIIGFVLALSIEIINLHLGRWAYNQYMPTIFGIGLSPLIQLPLTAFITFCLINKVYYYPYSFAFYS